MTSAITEELQNEELRKIHETLIPPKIETGASTVPPSASSTNTSSNIPQPLASSTEFIPHVFYTLYQIQKDPNNSTNQLENKTGFIKHRLRTCKTLIKDNEESIELLSKTPDEWEKILVNRQHELQIKKNVLLDLNAKISVITANNEFKTEPEEPATTEAKENKNGETVTTEVDVGDEEEGDVEMEL